jgi:hypothetical protein
VPLGIAHASATGLPLAPDVAGGALAVGLLVLLVVAYDFVRRRGIGGE